MNARVSGDGFVVSQVPAAGAPIDGDARLPPGSRTLALAARGDCEPSMTWAELHGALRGRGLIQADDALRAEAAVGVVTGIAYDSRTVTPGQVFVALKGQHADGTAFARQAIERGAAAVVSEQPAPDGVHVPWAIVDDARLALAVLAAAFYRDPSREMRVDRHHRHQRQDDDRLSDRLDLRRRRHPLRHPRHGRLPHRRRGARSDAHDARSAGGAGAAARDGRHAAAAPARWKCRRTRCRCAASTASRSPPASSRT